jgi:hypothetical protein
MWLNIEVFSVITVGFDSQGLETSYWGSYYCIICFQHSSNPIHIKERNRKREKFLSVILSYKRVIKCHRVGGKMQLKVTIGTKRESYRMKE